MSRAKNQPPSDDDRPSTEGETTPERDSSIIALTRTEVTPIGNTRKRNEPQRYRRRYFGVDRHGTEHLYAEFTSDEDYEAWRDTDPLLKEAHAQMFKTLLGQPKLRHWIIEAAISRRRGGERGL